MGIKCLMNGLEVNYPCSPACALFGDCVTAFEANKKASVRTNADRIRAMTDEELAEWMAECNAYGERAIASQWLPWLQQPVGGADHE